MDAQSGKTSFYVFSACIYCTAGLITVGSLLNFVVNYYIRIILFSKNKINACLASERIVVAALLDSKHILVLK